MASALLIAGCGGQKSETPQKKEMSLQLYSIRAEFKKAKEAGEDYSDILKKVAEAGFTSVEAASYNDGKLYGDEPQVYRKKVEDAGLVSLSSHVSCRLSPEELRRAERRHGVVQGERRRGERARRAGRGARGRRRLRGGAVK